MHAWLDCVPGALLLVDASGRVVWRNASARARLGTLAAPGAVVPVAWRDGDMPWTADGGTQWLQVQRHGAPDGLTLMQVDDVSELMKARAAAQRQEELLALARDAGRVGVWERDVRTLQGRWDRQMQRFWGLADGTGTPDFAAASQQILDADRPALEAAFRASLQRAGVHSHRYRVRRPDGGITHVHSQWAVKNGADGRPERVIGIMVDDTQAIESARRQHEMASQLDLAEDLAGLILWRHDLRTDRMHFNRPGYALIERAPTPEGVPAAEVRALIHPQDRPGVLAAAERALAGDGITDAEARHRQRDGSWRHVLTRRVLQRDEHGAPAAFVGVALDISARHAQTQRAHELAQRFEVATRTAGIGYWSREGGAERAHWSDQMRALHRLPADATVPTLREWLADFVHPADRAQVQARLRAWLSGPTASVQGELRIVTFDGQVRHLLTHSLRERDGAHPVQFGIAIDVTERRLADDALRRADERAALAARGAGIGTWELDLLTGESHWDEQMWRLRGRPPRAKAPEPDELLGFVHPEDAAPAATHVHAARAVTHALEAEFRVVWPDGTVRWLASRSSTLADAQGRPVRRIGVNWDVTATRLAEVERSEREAAERASQSKSRFLARMSHELRTPLNAVLGFAQLLQSEPDEAQRAQRLDHIRAAGEHLLSLIDDVLDLTSLDSGELRVAAEPVALAALVDETLPLLGALRERRGVTLAVEVGDLAVQADPTRLRQVLLNLLSNAIKYNRAGGHVALRARADGDRVELEVADTGRGLDRAQLQDLFQPFNRLGAERDGIEGTGIGLAIVKALTERMGGHVAVESRPGVGSCFTLTLPSAPAARAEPATDARGVRDAAVAPDARLDPARGVLYVEDNAVNALIVRELLAGRPTLRLRIAETGAAGLAMARTDPPALLLLDMQLPDMPGLAVLQALRSDPALTGLRCIALSANVLPEDIERTLAAGAADYWTKPLDLGAFRAALDAWFGLG
jgi:signal transduction histidine kinase